MELNKAQIRYLSDPVFREHKKKYARERYWRKKRQLIDDMLAAKRVNELKGKDE